ncbi:hypothetical protein ON010_g13596 [Phytophthora cinnamomi]|nr:hypothetical protein ON010_g13596 [Phytophthora cinnamomi]
MVAPQICWAMRSSRWAGNSAQDILCGGKTAPGSAEPNDYERPGGGRGGQLFLAFGHYCDLIYLPVEAVSIDHFLAPTISLPAGDLERILVKASVDTSTMETQPMHECTRQKLDRLEKGISNMLARIDRLGISVAPSEEEKRAFIAAQRRQRQLMRRLMKNVRIKFRFLAQCGGHPESIEARAILLHLAKKIKRDEAAFNTRVENTMQVISTLGMFSQANESDPAARRAKAALTELAGAASAIFREGTASLALSAI